MLPDIFYAITISPLSFLLSAILIVSSFFYLSLLALSEKVHVRIYHLPQYFFSLVTTHRRSAAYDHVYRGIVIDAHTREDLSHVTIQVRRSGAGKIVFHTKTTMKGRFRLHLPEQQTYVAHLSKKGYHAVECDLTMLPRGEEQTFALLKNSDAQTIQKRLLHEVGEFFAFSFETILLISIISALLLLGPFGPILMLPFFFLALFNLLLWMLHTIHMNS